MSDDIWGKEGGKRRKINHFSMSVTLNFRKKNIKMCIFSDHSNNDFKIQHTFCAKFSKPYFK